MITINSMYDLYCIENKTEIENINKELKILEDTINNIKDYFKETIEDTIFLEKILQGKEKPIIINKKEDKFFNIQLITYNNIYYRYNNKINKLKELENKLLSFIIYKYIIKRFNQLLVDAIIEQSYIFSNLFIGKLYIITGNNRKLVPDWVKSNKNKNKLIEEGKIPFCKKDYQDCVSKNIPYNGIKWLEYIDSFGILFKWKITSLQFVRLANIVNYTFLPYRSKNGTVKKLNIVKNKYTKEELIIKYKRDAN